MSDSTTTVEELFKHVLNELKRGHRPRLKLTKDQMTAYTNLWQSLDDQLSVDNNEQSYKEKLTPLLGILDHAINSSDDLASLFISSLKRIKDPELLVYLLSGTLKHAIEEKQKRGDRADQQTLSALETTLNHSSPEVLEWSLRCIEQLGSQSLYFKKNIMARKPSFLKQFNKHNKAARQIIEFLERRWMPG
jgi:hypothetical protein